MSASVPVSVPLIVTRASSTAPFRSATVEPIRVGVPFAAGAFDGKSSLAIVGSDGVTRPVQTRITDRWPDGSVRWLLVDFVLPVAAGVPAEWRGELRTVSAASAPLASASASPAAAASATRVRLEARELNGGQGAFVSERSTVEEDGPLRATVRQTGSIGGLKHPLLVDARVTAFADSPVIRLDITVRNPSAATHPGGTWDLGDPGSLMLERLTLTIPLTGVSSIRYAAEPGAAFASASAPLEIYQDSSGGEAWHSNVHLNRHREISTKFRGYRVRRGSGSESKTDTGLRASPVVTLQTQAGEISAAISDFWQNFPKAIEVTSDALLLHLFPPQTSGGHELQAGEQKTHTLFVSIAQAGAQSGADAVSGVEWALSPAICHSTPQYYASTRVMPYLTPLASERDPAYHALVASAIEGPESFERKRERLDEYGWRHFGDVYGDHEALFHPGPALLVSHWNNQYDTVHSAGRQFMRSGDPRWWTMMTQLAAHVADIDVYHTDKDKSAYNHGLFWHTAHYVDADIATHRTYPSQARVSSGEHKYESQTKVIGGGPACGHLYATGLALTWFLTGNAVARDAAIELADFVIDGDDGSKTVFRWLAGGYTGHASGSAWDNYHGPGRGSANAVNTLLDGYWLTGDRKYLEKAEQLIRRCVHPAEDLTRHRLDDVELRWFYTMFLQVLARYLDVKAESGAFDRMYRYARATLLRYARWMEKNAKPFLDKPENLEFPNETWAAQDMRKADIFYHAARHTSDPAERARLLERGDWYFRYVVDTLNGFPTKTLCRPVAILMGTGYMRNWLALHPADAAPKVDDVNEDFGAPEHFVGQKAVAMKRAKMIVAAGVMAGLGVVTLGVVWLLGGF
jgi:YetA-like protein